jgi:hypothetical protein
LGLMLYVLGRGSALDTQGQWSIHILIACIMCARYNCLQLRYGIFGAYMVISIPKEPHACSCMISFWVGKYFIGGIPMVGWLVGLFIHESAAGSGQLDCVKQFTPDLEHSYYHSMFSRIKLACILTLTNGLHDLLCTANV